eukprot:gene307-384_t
MPQSDLQTERSTLAGGQGSVSRQWLRDGWTAWLFLAIACLITAGTAWNAGASYWLAGSWTFSVLLIGISLMQVRARTVTEQHSRALSASEAEFRASFNSAAVGNSQVEPATGRYVRVNSKFCAITGYTESE